MADFRVFLTTQDAPIDNEAEEEAHKGPPRRKDLARVDPARLSRLLPPSRGRHFYSSG